MFGSAIRNIGAILGSMLAVALGVLVVPHFAIIAFLFHYNSTVGVLYTGTLFGLGGASVGELIFGAEKSTALIVLTVVVTLPILTFYSFSERICCGF